MNDFPIRPAADNEYERRLREINEALLISSVRQHERRPNYWFFVTDRLLSFGLAEVLETKKGTS